MWLFRWVSLLAVVLSFVLILRQGILSEDFVAPLQLLLNWYEIFVDFLFGWLKPHLEQLVLYLTGWDIALYPHWKHIFIPMWLYFSASSSLFFKREGPVLFDTHGNHFRLPSGRPATALLVIWGGVIAFAAAVGFGSVGLNSPSSTLRILAFPVVGVVLYELGVTIWLASFFPEIDDKWRQRFGRFSHGPRNFALAGGALLFAAKLSEGLLMSGDVLLSPALLLIGMVVALALFWALWAARQASREIQSTEVGWIDAFKKSGEARVSLLIFQAIGGVLVFVVANVGLNLIPGI